MVLELDQVRKDIERWMIDFLEISHPALNNWPPCPYARQARLSQSVDTRVGLDVYADLMDLSRNGLAGREVVIFAYDPKSWPRDRFAHDIERANQAFLVPRDLIALEDHPDDPEWVNGVCMNQGTYALVLCQQLADLNRRARVMAKRGFYQGWPEDYLMDLFQWREDPRT